MSRFSLRNNKKTTSSSRSFGYPSDDFQLEEVKEFIPRTMDDSNQKKLPTLKEAVIEEKLKNPSSGSVSNSNSEEETESIAKHPLQNAWTFWYKENDPSKLWEENQNIITTINTVEDFWCTYNYIKLPSEIKAGTDYSLFKEGIRPMWEDPANKKGGCWSISGSKQASKLDMDATWLDVMLCLIGESFDDSEEICGAVITNRKFNKITVWTANAHNTAAVLNIGKLLKHTLKLGNFHLSYHLHKDVMVKQGSTVKAVHTL